jgi:hypothetical protein
MGERLVPTRDLFLCQAAVIVVFILAENLAYQVHNMAVGLTIMIVAAAAAAFLGHHMLQRRAGAVNAYSVAMALGALIFWLKWWVLV